MSNLNLKINNFGPIKHASIELKKLNIIAGINGSGKTTLSKLLYCFLESNSNEGDYLANKSIYNRFKSMIDILKKELNSNRESRIKVEELSDNLPDLRDENFNTKLKTVISKVKIIISNSKLQTKNKHLEEISKIEKSLKINNNERRKFFYISSALLKSEFHINDLKINKNSSVYFYTQQKNCEFSCELNTNDSKIGFKINEGNLNCINNKNIININSISAFDIEYLPRILYLKKPQHHLRVLSRNMYLTKEDKDVYDSHFNQKIDACTDKINTLIGGCIYYNIYEEEFLFKTDHGEYHMKNTSSGVKQIGIIQILLSNRILNEDSFLIMDEPELHIHPEWQVKFAKLIILLIKELNITVFINSHSPQFIEALEVYSAKYALKNETNYYLSQKDKNSEKYNVKNILHDNLYEIYNNLGDSYDVIDKIRGKNIANHL